MPRLPSRVALSTLLDQHAALRSLLEHCDAVADAFEEGYASAMDLAAPLSRARRAFEEHARDEEAVLRPMILAAGPEGPVDVDRMVEEHVREHQEVAHRLADASAARTALATLRRHLAEEEGYLARLHGAAPAGAWSDAPRTRHAS